MGEAPGPAGRVERREEHVTATGWRVVGKAVSLVAESEERTSLLPGRDDDGLWASRFRVRPRVGTGSVVPTILTELTRAIAHDWADAPPLLPDRPLKRAPGRFHGLRWEPSGDKGSFRGELLWRHPHPVVAGAPCTTHVVIEEYSGHATLGIRVTSDLRVNGMRGSVGAGQARPAFIVDLNRAVRLTFAGHDTNPQTLTQFEVESFVRDVLLADDREVPVAVLAPLEDGTYVVPPMEIAEELTGLAHMYVMDRHPTTFALTDSVGDKRLSCFFGALRVYMPEFSCADRPQDHPLLVRERLIDPVMRAGLVGTLGILAGHHLHLASAFAEPVAVPSDRPASPDAPPVVVQAPVETAATVATPGTEDAIRLLATMPAVLAALTTQIGTLSDTIRGLVETNAALRDEIEKLRTTTAVRAASTNALERRIGGFEQLLSVRLPQPTPDVVSGIAVPADLDDQENEAEGEELTLVDVLRQAETTHSDALLVLDPAFRSAEESPYEDVDRLAVILEAMATVARRRQEGALGASLKDGFRDLGIDYRGGISSTTSEKHRQQYVVRSNGQTFDCHEHIVLGNSYDPRYCLRVYFTSRAPMEPRFVIGHVGRHFDVKSTT